VQSIATEVSSLKSLKDATHIELSGLSEWRYEISRKVINDYTHVLIQFQGVKPEELTRLLPLIDTRIKKVEVVEGIDSSALVDVTLNSSTISVFDYQTESPVNLVLDFYKEEAKPKAKAKRVAKTKSILKKEVAELVKHEDRTPAGIDALELVAQGNQPPLLSSSKKSDLKSPQMGIFDGGDKDLRRFKLEKYNETGLSLVRSQQNIYLHFPELIVKHFYIDEVFNGGLKFEMPQSSADDNSQMRLIIKLFQEDKPALTLRAMKFFKEKYPESAYDKMLDQIKAELYFKLWKRDHNRSDLQQAIALYKELLNRNREDPENFRRLMLIGLGYLELENNFGALSTFQVGVQSYPQSPYFWQMRMAVAEAYRNLNKPDDALKELASIEADPRSGVFAAEARYRRGDVFLHKKDFGQAVSEYREAFKKYPEHWSEAPNIFFNLAEASFWQKDYKVALDGFRDFLQRFPSSDFGGFAMTRLGEILEMLGESQKKVNGAYLESYFRFHDTSGAYLAKAHINSQRFSGLKPKELESVLKEQQAELPKDIEDVDAFMTLATADGFLTRKEFEKSRDMLIKYYQSNSLSPYLEIFKNRITKNITSEIESKNKSQDYVGAIAEFIRNTDNWLLKNPRIDTVFLAAQSYEALNVPDESLKLYQDCLEKVKKLSDAEIKSRSVFEKIPTVDEVSLRMAKVSEDASDYHKASEYLNTIKNPEKLTEPNQVERSLLSATVSEKEERFDMAINALKDLTEHWQGNPSLLSEPWLKLAQIYNSTGDYKTAAEYTEKIIASSPTTSLVMYDALVLSADLNLKKSKSAEAIKNLDLALEKFSDQSNSGPLRYKLGKIYFDQKNIRDAARVWGPLKSQTGAELWSKMADEKLSSAKWDLKYDRYFKDSKNERQPAGAKQ
jgi:tetratricopeptide (TPR) repeat protein